MVSIFVGSEEKKFVLHKLLLCKEAPYFNKMFNGNFDEANTQECYLKDEEPYAFELFVYYIYANRFPDDVNTVAGVILVFEPIVKFYVLADKLLMSKAAKTACLDALIAARAASGHRFGENTVKFVLSHTAEGCPLRKLVVDIIARDFLDFSPMGQNWLTACLKDAPFEQILQLMMAIKQVACVKPALTEEFCKKMVREKRSITSVPEYQTGYLKIEPVSVDGRYSRKGTRRANPVKTAKQAKPATKLAKTSAVYFHIDLDNDSEEEEVWATGLPV